MTIKMTSDEIKARLIEISNETSTIPGWITVGQGASKAPTASELMYHVSLGSFDGSEVEDFDEALFVEACPDGMDGTEWIQCRAGGMVFWIWID